jgi:hypothetical protein
MQPKKIKMANKKELKEEIKRTRKKFLDVDVWRSHFGAVSVTAIYDVFMSRFNIEKHKLKNYSFSHCVESLRKLEDEEYECKGSFTRRN